MNRTARTAVALLLSTNAAACASTSRVASERANRALAKAAITVKAPEAPAPTSPGCGSADPSDLTKSLRPYAVQPGAGHMPAGSFLSAIAKRGTLHAGVDENTLPLSFRDPRTGAFHGFEIDVLNDIANAIIGTHGDRSSLRPIPVITKQKVSVVHDGQVDLTASAVSITCDRWSQVLFTIPYYRASEKLMVRTNQHRRPVFADGSVLATTSDKHTLDHAFAQKRICATKGSTAEQAIRKQLPHAISVLVPTRTDCLVALQDDTVDAILLHDTFLLGFQKQDPNTTILTPSFGTQYYGIAVQRGHEDLVRFINGLIVSMRASGRLEDLYQRNFAPLGAPSTMPGLKPPKWLD